jgi:DNA-binding CsgD family transcriptional regulator/tetratricopeptide (TPR) repeat protein
VTSELLIGREKSLRVLEDVVAAAAEGRPRIAVLAGEAGIGKTRLLAALETSARERGFLVLHGEGIEFGGEEYAYAPIIGALRTLSPEDDFAALLPSGATAALGQSVLGERVLELLGRQPAPVLLALEDVHWADRSTRNLLAFLARNLTTERVALAMTYRTGELDADSPLRRLLAELVSRAHVERVDVAPLAHDEVARQLETIAGGPVRAGIVDELHARAGGNPFYVEELFAAQDGDALPATLAEAVLLRTARLSDPGRELLGVVAAAGGRIDHDLLEHLLPADELPGALRSARDLGFVVRADDGIAFRHGLMGEAVYGELLPQERRELHMAIARALSEIPGAPAAQLAHQFYRAGDRENALRASLTAGLEAARLYAYAEALGHLERAIELWDDEAELSVDHVELLSTAAQAARYTGNSERAVELVLEALEELDPDDDPVRAALLHERLGDYHFWDDEAALDYYGRALELLPDDAGAERARLLVAEGHALLGLRRWREAVERCEAALEVADEAREASARITLGLTLAFLGDGAAGEAQVRDGLAVAESLSLGEETARGYMYLGELQRLRGDRAAALDAMIAGEQTAARLGMPGSYGHFMYVNAIEDLLALGRWDEAEGRVLAAERMELSPTGAAMHGASAGRLYALSGDLKAARSHLERASDDGLPSEFVTPLKASWAELALAEGRPDDARHHVEEAFAVIDEAKDLLYTPHLHSLGVRAEAEISERARSLRREQDALAARSRAETLLADLDRTIAETVSTPPGALAHRALALAEWGRVVGVARPQAWRAASEAWDRIGEPYHGAYARFRQAEATLTAGGDRVEAARLLAEAHGIATALGAGPLAAEIETLARRARLELAASPAPSAAVAEPAAGLTAREREVLRLLAEGLTNREIAARLFISQKTVGAHVAHIFEKLDVHSRLEAAARAQQIGVLSP